MPVAFSYSGARVFTKKSSKALMNELSRTVPMAFGALPPALAQLGASVAPVATSPTVTNSRRVVMGGLRSDGRCDRADGGDGRQGFQTCQVRAATGNPRRVKFDR